MSKERLVELIVEAYYGLKTVDEIAEFLLANGVCVLPCKVGDYIEWDTGFEKQLHQVRGFYIDQHGMMRYSLKDFAPSLEHPKITRIVPREEAEQKLKGDKIAIQ